MAKAPPHNCNESPHYFDRWDVKRCSVCKFDVPPPYSPNRGPVIRENAGNRGPSHA